MCARELDRTNEVNVQVVFFPRINELMIFLFIQPYNYSSVIRFRATLIKHSRLPPWLKDNSYSISVIAGENFFYDLYVQTVGDNNVVLESFPTFWRKN